MRVQLKPFRLMNCWNCSPFDSFRFDELFLQRRTTLLRAFYEHLELESKSQSTETSSQIENDAVHDSPASPEHLAPYFVIKPGS
jgi:hypothetical protein